MDIDVTLHIECCSQKAAAEISAVSRECFSDAWSEAAVAATLESEQNIVITAKNKNGIIIGFAMASAAADTADILDIAVLPSYRRRGTGRRLLSELINILSESMLKMYILK